MEKDNLLSELIYEYYESRILFGMYRYGDQLRSVSQICASFGLARNTVQAALNKLEAAGYIKTEHGQDCVPGNGGNLQGECHKVFCTAQRGDAGY